MPIDPQLVNELGAVISGRIYTPADSAWPAVSMSWNPSLPQHPVAVVEAATVEDVVETVRYGQAHNVPVAAQADGHASTSAIDGTILVRPIGLTDIEIDTPSKTARIGAGVRWHELLERLEGTGLGALAGSHPDINVVAFLLGGGLSWFSRGFGRGSAYLVSVQLVDGQGEVRNVDDSTDPNLMRALRGGGGEFGIVTAATIALVDIPALSGGRLEIPGAVIEPLTPAFVSVVEAAPRESAWAIGFGLIPPMPDIPPELHGKPIVHIDVVHRGPESDLTLALDSLSTVGPVIRSTVADREISTLGEVAEEPREPSPIRHCSFLIDGIDADVVSRLSQVAFSQPALLNVELRQLGGALAAEPARPSVAGPIAAGGLVTALALALDEGMVAAGAAAFEALAAALADRIVPGLPFTFLTESQGIGEAYGEQELEFLRSVRAEVNPDGTIRGNRHLV